PGGIKYDGDNAIILAYIAWLNYNVEGYSVFTPVGLILAGAQGSMKQIAAEEGVNWIDTFFFFVNQSDCQAGHCYVGDARLYTEPLHTSAVGYSLWGILMGRWMKDHDWDTPLVVNGVRHNPVGVDAAYWAANPPKGDEPNTNPDVG